MVHHLAFLYAEAAIIVLTAAVLAPSTVALGLSTPLPASARGEGASTGVTSCRLAILRGRPKGTLCLRSRAPDKQVAQKK